MNRCQVKVLNSINLNKKQKINNKIIINNNYKFKISQHLNQNLTQNKLITL